MSLYSIIQGQTGYVNPQTSILDTGWTVDGVYATHGSCNMGTMVAANDFGLQVGRSYVFEYIVDKYINGSVRLFAGTTPGTSRTAAGTYKETLVVEGNNFLSFFSDGGLRIHDLTFYDELLGPQPGRTISFNERANKWVSEYSFMPEMMVKFIDKLFSFSNGSLWQHNVNPLMNNFYGVQYPSQVVFISNQEYQKNKLWFNLRTDSTGGWYCPSIVTPPDDQFPNGMETVLTRNNMKVIDGKLWADILRDVTDPNFAFITDPGLRAANALFRGRMMQGGWLIVTMQNDDITPATLSSAEIYYIDVQKSL